MSTSLSRHQQRFQLIFEHSPIAIWEEDLSVVAQLTKKLHYQKILDVRQYLTEHPDVVKKTFRKIKILDVNRAALDLYGAKNKRELIVNFGKTLTVDAVKVLTNEFASLAEGSKYFESEFKSRHMNGQFYYVILRLSVPAGYEKTLSRVIITLQNITEQKKLEKHLKLIAQQDSLTRFLNSRAIMGRLEEELIRSRRYDIDFSCLMVDIDRFKRINDGLGHQKGDQVLKKIASLIKNSLRRSDIIGRYGGDEFFIILTETKPENAKIAAERIRKIVSSFEFKLQKTKTFKLSISIGISGYPSKDIRDYRDLVAKADKALYQAKASGRNCTVVAD